MVFVKVRETYDLHTTKDRMTVIGIHTPKPDIIKQNFPGLFLQCKAYRPYSCDVRVACASMLPLDPLGVGTGSGDISPEDVFNPILYKAISNKGMSQLEARITALANGFDTSISSTDVVGDSAFVETDDFTNQTDDFNVYYGLLSNAHGWKHANPQSGLSMSGLRPLVYEMLYNIPDQVNAGTNGGQDFYFPAKDGAAKNANGKNIVGDAKPLPFMNTTSYHGTTYSKECGFPDVPTNAETRIPYICCMVGAIIVPPSRLHELFYRMVVEWTVEFTAIRPVGEIVDFPLGDGYLGGQTHYQNYSYSSAKEALTGSDESILEDDSCMVSANVDVKKVM